MVPQRFGPVVSRSPAARGDDLSVSPASTRSVLALIDGYRATDGPARQLLAAATAGPGAGFQTVLAVVQRRDGSPNMVVDAAARLGIATTTLRDRFPGDPRTLRDVAALLRTMPVHVLQTHGYKANVLAAVLRGSSGRPWVAFLHGETSENMRVRAYFALEKLAVRRADRVCVMSQAMADGIAARGVPRHRLRVIYNACLFQPAAPGPRAPVDAGPLVVGIVGRLSPEKGVDLGLRAFAIARRSMPESVLWIAGQGPEETRLRKLAAAQGLSDSVRWLGYYPDVRDLYPRLAVLLLPSRSEGLPNVALEAMTHGVPVVAAAVGGVPEVVTDGLTGFLAPSGDSRALAGHLVTVLADPGLRDRLGRAGHDLVRVRFSLDVRLRALATLYREISA